MKTLVLGGARSGKSQYCVEELRAKYKRPCLVVTAEVKDEEMALRIAKHRESRPKEWQVLEEPINLGPCLKNLTGDMDVVLVDCLTLWLSNILLKFGASEAELLANELIEEVKGFNKDLFLVSNEVGLGIVPDNELARLFRDLAGKLNQKMAMVCDSVIFVVAGIPIKLK